jgi:hypothetical protein
MNIYRKKTIIKKKRKIIMPEKLGSADDILAMALGGMNG